MQFSQMLTGFLKQYHKIAFVNITAELIGKVFKYWEVVWLMLLDTRFPKFYFSLENSDFIIGNNYCFHWHDRLTSFIFEKMSEQLWCVCQVCFVYSRVPWQRAGWLTAHPQGLPLDISCPSECSAVNTSPRSFLQNGHVPKGWALIKLILFLLLFQGHSSVKLAFFLNFILFFYTAGSY